MSFTDQLKRRYNIGAQLKLICEVHPELASSPDLVQTQNRGYIFLLLHAVLEFFYHQGIRKGLGISLPQEQELAEFLLVQDWSKIIGVERFEVQDEAPSHDTPSHSDRDGGGI